MANRYSLITNRKVDTPMTTKLLLPFEGQATESQINSYQAKVGSALYNTTTTRPDVAKATAKIAEFLMNPGPRHIDAIDRVIQYLHQTRFLAIEYGRRSLNKDKEKSVTEGIDFAAKSIEFATNALFGDNPDRRSSEGYICKLYSGPID
jgi:hypothetical protein